MKAIKRFFMALTVIVSLGGCAYTNIRSPLDTGLERTELGSKVGTASNYAVLWLVAWGDASYAKAAQNAGIKVMRHSDEEFRQYFFGLYVKQTTIVYGD